MSSRGVQQLKRISLFFCDWGGSSEGARNFLRSEQLKNFMSKNSHINFEFIRKRNHHPYISGLYINGYIKDVPLRNSSTKQIFDHYALCNNSFGKHAIKANGKRVIGVKQSFQGKWFPNMWGNVSRAQMQRLHVLQQPQVALREQRQLPTKPTKQQDMVSQLRKHRVRQTRDTIY